MLIYFRRSGVYVPVAVLPKYLWWVFRNALAGRSLRHFVRSLWAPKWHQRIPSGVEHVLAVARSLGLGNGWIRWDTDGSRRQVFDPWRGLVCKIQKHSAALDIDDEIELRTALGDLSPRILKRDSMHMAYAEEWVDATPGCCSVDELESVLRLLGDRLYRTAEISISDYIQDDTISFSDEACNLVPSLVQRLGRATLPISTVHGDLVCSNIAFLRNGRPILYDWEYSRACVVTYDVWYFLYHRMLAMDSCSELPEFLNVFRSMIDWAFPTIQDISALHLIHLFEREALLLKNSVFVDSDHALKTVRQSIEESLVSQ